MGMGIWMHVPLPPAQLRQALLPHLAETHFDFEAVGYLLAVGRVELREAATRKQVCEDLAEVAVDLLPRFPEGLLLVLVERLDRLFDLALVAHDRLHHLLERGFLLLDAVDHVHDFGVDLFLHALEALGQVLEAGFAFGDVLAVEVVGRVGAAEAVLFVVYPLVLAFHGS